MAREPGMLLWLDDEHTVADVEKAWGGMDPHTEVPTRAIFRNPSVCDACGRPATRITRIVWR